MPTRTVLVTTSYPSGEDDPSGHFVRAHARELAEGSEVVVLAPGVGDEQRGRLSVRRLGGGSLFGWPGVEARLAERPHRLFGALPFAARVASALRALGPFDRAVAHWIVPSAFPLLLAGPRDLEVVAHGADVRALLRAPGPLRALVLRSLLDRGARFRFVAGELLDRLARGADPRLARELFAASFVAPAPIDVPPRESLPDPRRLRAQPLGRYVAWAGRLVDDKRPLLAVDVAARAGVTLVVLGDGPRLADVRAAGPHVLALGRVGRSEALAWLAHAEALLCTSRTEGAPTVVREARALGVPVVSTRVGDVARWALVDPALAAVDDDGLVEALTSVLARA